MREIILICVLIIIICLAHKSPSNTSDKAYKAKVGNMNFVFTVSQKEINEANF